MLAVIIIVLYSNCKTPKEANLEKQIYFAGGSKRRRAYARMGMVGVAIGSKFHRREKLAGSRKKRA